MNNFNTILTKQREFFYTHETKSLTFRVNQLKKLKQLIKDHETIILEALYKDLGKSKFEAFVTEIGMLYDEINFSIKHLPKWMKAKKVKTPIVHFRAKSFIVSEPYGQVLIIAPWNYPFQLALSPLVGAIAAGNTAIIKPSEYSVHTSHVLEKLINENFEEHYLKVVQGDKETTEQLLNHKFDYIFFTGSVNVGRIIMEKAAKHLTPVTLELGGKSPCIVYSDANIELAAKKIIFGKLMNTGQTCVAPDYLIVHRLVKDELIKHIIAYIKTFFGDNLLNNEGYPKIISPRHFKRLITMIEDKSIIYGGRFNEESLKIEPTLIENVPNEDALLNEEIFGPILPIIPFDDIDEVIRIVNAKPKPLALYLFTNNKVVEDQVINHISFGGGCVNDTLIHLASSHLPFGGVGESGIGSYHGEASFDTFTHRKSILKKSSFVELDLKYPPYNDKKYQFIKRIFK